VSAAEQTVLLFKLFDAFRAAPYGSIMLHESAALGAAAALDAWAAAIGLTCRDQMIPADELGAGYVNRNVDMDDMPSRYIAVLHYRDKTADEIAADHDHHSHAEQGAEQR
jgi:hypothetical protein